MTWDYRVLKEDKTVSGGVGFFKEFRIIEVYYNNDGTIDGWSNYSADLLINNNDEDLKETIDKLQLALKKPVLMIFENELIDAFLI